MSTLVEELRSQLSQAAEDAVDDETRDHIEAAIELVTDLPQSDLIECPVCERVGLPKRIANHDYKTATTE